MTISSSGLGGTVLGALFVIGGVAVAVPAGYLLVLAIAALFYRADHLPRLRRESPSSRLVVLIPAHNESHGIAGCVQSLLDQSYPRPLYRVVVIADNCTDDTGAIAEAAGAEVDIRNRPDARGKGHALRWEMDRLLAAPEPPDAVVVVDADSRPQPDFLSRLVAAFEAGGNVVQGESLLDPGTSSRGSLGAAAFLLVNRVRPSGRAVLHLPCNLAGNGMLLGRRILETHPWNAYTSTEDLEYGIQLRLAGERPVFARGAIVYSPAVTRRQAALQQRLRWEGGKMNVARTHIGLLVKRAVRDRTLSLLETALDLAVPPLSILAGAAVAGTVAAAALVWWGVLPGWALIPWVVAALSVPGFVLIGFRAAGAPPSAYRAMLRAPAFVVAKLATSRHLLGFRADTWVRAERPNERADLPRPQRAAHALPDLPDLESP